MGANLDITLPATSKAAAKKKSNTHIGADSVKRIAALMRVRGYAVKTHLPYNSPFDLLCNGKRVEVKTATYHHLEDGVFGWMVNIHRHGKVNESHVDVYVIELCADFLPNPIVLIRPAPINASTCCWYVSGLFKGKHAAHIDNWSLLEPIRKNPTIPDLNRQQGATA